MTNAPTVYQGVLNRLDRGQWQDCRHLKTAVNRMVGLIWSSAMSLTSWIPSTVSRAWQSPSVQRRFARWLDHDRLDVHLLEAPLLQEAWRAWGEAPWSLALATPRRWDQYGLRRWRVI